MTKDPNIVSSESLEEASKNISKFFTGFWVFGSLINYEKEQKR